MVRLQPEMVLPFVAPESLNPSQDLLRPCILFLQDSWLRLPSLSPQPYCLTSLAEDLVLYPKQP